MKKIALSILFAVTTFFSGVGQIRTDIVNIKEVTEAKKVSRSKIVSYDNRKEAEGYDYDKSTFYLPMNGNWHFRFKPESAPKNEFGNIDNVASWKEIPIPATWESLGLAYNDKNSVGQYFAQMELPFGWRDREIFFVVEGASPSVSLYINGVFAGRSENSRERAEFVITKFIQDGINDIAFEVDCDSKGKMLENGVNSLKEGVLGGVYIHSQPMVYIYDYKAEATLDSTETKPFISLDIVVANRYNSDEKVTVYYDIMDDRNEIIKYNYAEFDIPARGYDTIHYESAINGLQFWNVENPKRYRLMMRLKYNGRFTEYIPIKIGFRKVAYDSNGTYINNKPVKINGLNYNKLSYNKSEIINDIKALKASGVNTLRVVGQPQIFYDVCNDLGIYICDEVNINCKESGTSLYKGGTLGNDPKFKDMFLARIEGQYYADRNNPSVIMWSLGQDAGNGYNNYESYLKMKSLEDQGRAVVYSGAGKEWNTDIIFMANPDENTIKNISGVAIIGSDFIKSDDFKKFNAGGFANALTEEIKTLYKPKVAPKTPVKRR